MTTFRVHCRATGLNPPRECVLYADVFHGHWPLPDMLATARQWIPLSDILSDGSLVLDGRRVGTWEAREL